MDSEPTLATFAATLGESYAVDPSSQLEADPVELELVEAKATTAPPAEATGIRGEPYALLFRGPAEPRLPQATYPFEHEAVGRLEIFIVPVAGDDGETSYEAIFT